jgi:dipicolinate synthase subunit B
MLIGYALCGSFCTFDQSIAEMARLAAEGYDILPIMSENAYSTDTRFGKAIDFSDKVSYICGRQIIHTIKDAEPLGPKIKLDMLIISPCTGNTLAKMANGITDTAVTMAAKAHLRNGGPLLIALATNDAMSANLSNIGVLLNRKNVYFVPLVQDDPAQKPNSLVADFSMIGNAISAALAGRQLRPLFK